MLLRHGPVQPAPECRCRGVCQSQPAGRMLFAMRHTLLLVPLVLLAALCSPAARVSAQVESALLDEAVAALLHEELSGELAKEHVIAITRHHRIQGSRGYRDSAQWLLARLREFGFDESQAWIESYPSDGKTEYQTWQSPSGWDIESAELRMLTPFDERISAYPEIAMSVITYSNAGEATAPLVFVGAGTRPADYIEKDVVGKFVLATGYGGSVHRAAVIERGAAGVICYLDDERAADHPDMLAYTGMWPRSEELDAVTFGFNLTNRQGERLRALLESGEEVVLHGRVSGIGLEPFAMDVIVAVIGGTDLADEEIVLSAHLDHPKESANDNASGSAALLDMARSLRTLMDAGRLAEPRRTLRFLWVPEFFGTMAYIDAHPELVGPELGGKVLANLNLDMVGEDTEQLHCRLEITRTPASLPSVLNDVVANMAALVDRTDVRTPRGSQSAFNYRMTPYASGSDHMVFIDRKVPGMMFWHNPDYTHHTSDDTPDKVDPVELERCELIAAGSAWYLANLSKLEAIDLAWLAAARAAGRLGAAGRRAQALILAADEDDVGQAWAEAANVIDFATKWEVATMRSVIDFQGDPIVARVISAIAKTLSDQWSALRAGLQTMAAARGIQRNEPPALHAWTDERVPGRLTRGVLAFDLLERRLSPERFSWYSTPAAPGGDQRFELVNFINGERDVTAIRNSLSAEFAPIDLDVVGRMLEDLVEVGVVEWR